jgi:hypothetical protein
MSDGFYDDEDEDKEEEDDRPSFKRARRNSPRTSKEAAASPKRETQQQRMYEVFRQYCPMTASRAAKIARIADGWKRVNELMERGLLAPSGDYEENSTGKEGIVWKPITPAQKAFLVTWVSLGFASTDTLMEKFEKDPAFDYFYRRMNDRSFAEYCRHRNKFYWDKLKDISIEEAMDKYEFVDGMVRERK